MKRCLSLFAVLLLSSTASANVLVNGSFDGPTTDGGAGTTIPFGWTRTGTNGKSFVVNDPGGNAVDGPNYLQLGQFTQLRQVTPLVVTPGTTYDLAAFGRSFEAGPYDVRVYAVSNPLADITTGTVVGILQFPGDNSVTTMTEMTTQFTPAPSEVGKTLAMYIATHANFYGFDNIRLSVAIPEPSTVMLAGASALGGLVLLRRRSQG